MIREFEDKFEVSYEVYLNIDDDIEPMYFCDQLQQLLDFMNKFENHTLFEIALVYDSFSKEKESEVVYVTKSVNELISEVVKRAEEADLEPVIYVH